MHGIAVRNNLKSLLTFELGSRIFSVCTSRFGSQSSNKWQLQSMTQLPKAEPAEIACNAFSSEPLPSDTSRMVLSFSFSFLSSFSKVRESSLMVSEGSAPLDSTKINGVRSSESAIVSSMSTGGGLANSSPIFQRTYDFIMNISFSGFTALTNSAFLNKSSWG